jgi:glycosyltransferase involved in cell wall biosynthesis
MVNVALVHEWLVTRAGSEQVVEALLAEYPQADLFSLVEFLPEALRSMIHHKPVTTSFIQHLPFARSQFRQYLLLMPLAIEQLDVTDYDIVISSSHAVAKGILTRADQLHISYVHTPVRYAWDLHHHYLKGVGQGLKAIAVRATLHYLRLWDVATANRVDHFVANSRYVARRIWKTYRRPATVIYPPVNVERFRPARQRDDFYLTVSRFVPYKRVDLIVAAFARLGLPLVVIGDGSDREQIQSLLTPNITWLGHQPDAVVTDYMERCKAFVFAAEEDFGITPVEAQAAGAPVIAYGKGGVTETIIPGKTGHFFPEQTVESLIEAITHHEAQPLPTDPDWLHHHAQQFSIQRFRQEFSVLIDQNWAKFQRGDGLEY